MKPEILAFFKELEELREFETIKLPISHTSDIDFAYNALRDFYKKIQGHIPFEEDVQTEMQYVGDKLRELKQPKISFKEAEEIKKNVMFSFRTILGNT